jgi:antitoxin component of MazEF toxin-antitoxin module
MTPQTNPRKLTTSGGMTVVSIPTGFLEEAGLKKGDRVVLETDGNGFKAVPVEWEVRD